MNAQTLILATVGITTVLFVGNRSLVGIIQTAQTCALVRGSSPLTWFGRHCIECLENGWLHGLVVVVEKNIYLLAQDLYSLQAITPKQKRLRNDP